MTEEEIKEILESGKLFVVAFRKINGEVRILTGRTAADTKPGKNPKNVTVIDLVAQAPRTVNIERVFAISEGR